MQHIGGISQFVEVELKGKLYLSIVGSNHVQRSISGLHSNYDHENSLTKAAESYNSQ